MPRPFRALRRALARALGRLAGPTLIGGLLAVAVLSVIGAAPADAAATSVSVQPAAPRAMWVWNQPAAKTLVSFAQARGVTELFVSVPDALPSSARLTWVKSLAKLTAPAGIRLSALGGDPGWVDDTAAAVNWERAALSTGLFTGVHVDIEPWQHPDWDTDQAAVVGRYLDTLSALQSASAVPLEADVSFWLWTLSTADGTPVDAAVLQRVDKVTVMSYRNTVTGADSITDIGAHTLATAVAAGKPARLAVETRDLGSDPVSRKQTFFGKTEAALNTALGQVDAAEAGSPSYAGVAVHDYVGYDALR